MKKECNFVSKKKRNKKKEYTLKKDKIKPN